MNSKKTEFKAIDMGRADIDLSDIARKQTLFPESIPIRIYHSVKDRQSTFTIVMQGHYGISYGTITVDQLNRALRKIGFDLSRCKSATMEDLKLDLDDVRILAFRESLTEDMWSLHRKQVAESLLDKYNITFKDDFNG